MAGNPRYTVLLDACVFYPAFTRDVLLSLAFAGLFSARWTRCIETEWTRNLAADRPDVADRLPQLVELARRAVPDWEIDAASYEPLIPALALPDPDDRHVLAAALAGRCDAIVTANLKDFPPSALDPHHIDRHHPDDFVLLQLELDPFVGLAALRAMRARLRHPPAEPAQFVALFDKYRLPQTAAWLSRAGRIALL